MPSIPFANRLARAIIDRYPAAWRQRYADEMLALIDAQPLRWRDVVDLERRCLIERARSLFEPGDHPFLAALVAGGTNGGLSLLTGIVIALAAWAAGRALAAAFSPVPDWLMVPAVLVLLAGWFRHIRLMWKRRQVLNVPLPAEPFRRTLAWSVALFASVVLMQLGADSSTQLWSSWFWTVLLFTYQFDWVWPSNGLPEALNQRALALESLKWARMELTRCETVADGRVTADLTRAQAEVQRLQTMHDDAMRALHGMGYRATFQ